MGGISLRHPPLSANHFSKPLNDQEPKKQIKREKQFKTVTRNEAFCKSSLWGFSYILQYLGGSFCKMIWKFFFQSQDSPNPPQRTGFAQNRGLAIKRPILQNEAPKPQADNLQNKGFGPCNLRGLPATLSAENSLINLVRPPR